MQSTTNVTSFQRAMAICMGAAFFLGIPVGFLFRPLLDPATLIQPAPPSFSLWGYWQLPALLLLGAILLKVLFSSPAYPSGNMRWPAVLKYGVFGLLSGLLVVFAIAPSDVFGIPESGGSFSSWRTFFILSGFLANPLVVGIAASFALGGRKSDPGWHAPVTAILAWAGTLTLFLPLAVVYFQVIKQVPQRYFLSGGSLLWAGLPVWLLLGFLLALIGGFFGRLFSNLVVEKL